jgi:hypothetical protein
MDGYETDKTSSTNERSVHKILIGKSHYDCFKLRVCMCVCNDNIKMFLN